MRIRRDEYAKDWASDKDWVVRMAHGSHSEGTEELRFLGDEWSPAADLARVVHEFIEPFVSAESCAGEIGSGGGRVAARRRRRRGEHHDRVEREGEIM